MFGALEGSVVSAVRDSEASEAVGEEEEEGLAAWEVSEGQHQAYSHLSHLRRGHQP